MTVKSWFLTTIKTKTPWQAWWLHLSKSQPSSLSSVAIFRHHERTKFTSHNSYAILEYIDLLDRVHLLTQKLLKQSYVDHKLKSSLQKLYDCQDSSSRSGWPVTKYQISNDNGSFPFYVDYFSFLYHRQDFYILVTRRVSYEKQEQLTCPSRGHGFNAVFGGINAAYLFSFLCFVCLRAVSCVPSVASRSGLSILDCPFGFLQRSFHTILHLWHI
jgi:hypothetical protein